jgi:hypothetical protein
MSAQLSRVDVDSMSLSEACNEVVKRLVAQGGRSMSKDGNSCLYGDGDKHCAIGWMLDTGDKRLMSYNGGIVALVSRYPRLLPRAISDIDNEDILGAFQAFHDEKGPLGREIIRDELTKLGIDTTHPQWDEWIEMGATDMGDTE